MICGFDHVVIAVSDIDQAIRTWRDMFGMSLSHRVSNPEAHMEAAFFCLQDGGFIELVSPMNDQASIHPFLQDRGEGIRLLCLHVDDLDAAIADLTAKGVALAGVGTPWVFVRPEAANGVMLQLWPRKRPHKWRDGDVLELEGRK